jgi:hypothetical protein
VEGLGNAAGFLTDSGTHTHCSEEKIKKAYEGVDKSDFPFLFSWWHSVSSLLCAQLLTDLTWLLILDEWCSGQTIPSPRARALPPAWSGTLQSLPFLHINSVNPHKDPEIVLVASAFSR